MAVGFSGVICLMWSRTDAEMIEMKSLNYRAKFRPECDLQQGDRKVTEWWFLNVFYFQWLHSPNSICAFSLQNGVWYPAMHFPVDRKIIKIHLLLLSRSIWFVTVGVREPEIRFAVCYVLFGNKRQNSYFSTYFSVWVLLRAEVIISGQELSFQPAIFDRWQT